MKRGTLLPFQADYTPRNRGSPHSCSFWVSLRQYLSSSPDHQSLSHWDGTNIQTASWFPVSGDDAMGNLTPPLAWTYWWLGGCHTKCWHCGHWVLLILIWASIHVLIRPHLSYYQVPETISYWPLWWQGYTMVWQDIIQHAGQTNSTMDMELPLYLGIMPRQDSFLLWASYGEHLSLFPGP